MPEMAARAADVQQRTAMVWSWWKSFAWLFKLFFQASPPRSCANPAVFFPPLKRREDLRRKQKGAEGYFAEGKIFLLL